MDSTAPADSTQQTIDTILRIASTLTDRQAADLARAHRAGDRREFTGTLDRAVAVCEKRHLDQFREVEDVSVARYQEWAADDDARADEEFGNVAKAPGLAQMLRLCLFGVLAGSLLRIAGVGPAALPLVALGVFVLAVVAAAGRMTLRAELKVRRRGRVLDDAWAAIEGAVAAVSAGPAIDDRDREALTRAWRATIPQVSV